MARLPMGTVTFLFTDVEGSTRLWEAHPEAMRTALARHDHLIEQTVALHGGQVVRPRGEGDSRFCVFARATDAVVAAATVQQALHAEPWPMPAPLKVRMALHTGEADLREGDYYGSAVNRCARLRAIAHGGQTLLSQATADLARDGLRGGLALRDLGEQRLVDLIAAERVFQLTDPACQDDFPPLRSLAAMPNNLPAAGHTGPLVGREVEQIAIDRELDIAKAGALRVLVIEGEAGIGKTRLLGAVAESALAREMLPVYAGADEDLRAPFLLARMLLEAPPFVGLAQRAGARGPLDRAIAALAGGGFEGGGGLSAWEERLRVLDAAGLVLRALSSHRPLVLLFDDLQWADEPSLQLLRYLARVAPSCPILVGLALRSEDTPAASDAMRLVADLERARLVRRLQVGRLARAQTTEFLEGQLGGPVARSSASLLHTRSEGVPFFVEELVRLLQDTGGLHRIQGTWQVTPAAERRVPPSVQVLVERRVDRLPDGTRPVLAAAALLGRSFLVTSLAELVQRIGEGPPDPTDLETLLRPAVQSGLLTELADGGGADYQFAHEQVRAVLADSQSRPRRRRIHAAIVDMLAGPEDREPTGASLPLLAHHALAAGDVERGMRFVVAAARSALDGHAPEEALRLVDEADLIATSPRDRVELLCLRDEALSVLGRDEERLAALAELATLARALGDAALELNILLRRAAAARATGDERQALELARSARDEAHRAGDGAAELRANLELGQTMLASPLGESFEPPPREGLDFDGAAEAFARARALAEAAGDLRSVAGAQRELAVVELGRAKLIRRELRDRRVADADAFTDPLVRDHMAEARRLLGHALELYERLGDRRGSMSSLIALAYAQPPAETRRGEAGRIEQVRRLRVRLRSLTTESEEATNEVHMLYGVQVYARANGYPDLALERGRDAHRAARALGDRFLEFLAAYGLALSHLELCEIAAAEEWLDRAGTAALAQPSLPRERQLELCRGFARAAAGDAETAMGYLQRAVALATQHGSPAARSETLAAAALAGARLGVAGDQPQVLDWAEACASESRRLAATLHGPLPWEAQAFAASARAALARGEPSAATDAARSALTCLRTRLPEGLHAEIRLIVAQALLAGGAHDEAAEARARIRAVLRTVAERILDDDVRLRWFASPFHAELASDAGEEPNLPPIGAHPGGPKLPGGLTEREGVA